MKKAPCSLVLSACMVIIIFLASCKVHYGNRVKDIAKVELGLVMPEIRERKNDTVSLALYPNARMFFIDLGLKNSAHYLQLMKKASKAEMPVRARVFENNTSEVAEIYAPSVQDIEDYKKRMIKPR